MPRFRWTSTLPIALICITSACVEDADPTPDLAANDNWQAPVVQRSAAHDLAWCPPGTEPVEPGCGDPPPGMVVPEPGCHVPCSPEGEDCAAGEVCVAIWGNPCICDLGEECCRACGAEQSFCIPVVDACPPGEVYAEPGCDNPFPGSHALEEAGCYEPCKEAGKPCENGGVCVEAYVNPCVCPPGEACCQACGGGSLLCLDPA